MNTEEKKAVLETMGWQFSVEPKTTGIRIGFTVIVIAPNGKEYSGVSSHDKSCLADEVDIVYNEVVTLGYRGFYEHL
jgi:hypothetical protein